MTCMSWNSSRQLWEKECNICKVIFSVAADKFEAATEEFTLHFSRGASFIDGLQTRCKSCIHQTRDGRVSNGLSKEEMFKLQNGLCSVGGEPLTLTHSHGAYVDHDHKTGKIRGLICPRCNMLLAGVDDDEWLCKAIKYRDTNRNT